MDERPIRFTSRDRLLRAWQNSMELVRDFQLYAGEEQHTNDTRALFRELAEEECMHAARLREQLHRYDG